MTDDTPINDFISFLSNTHNIDTETVLNSWKEFQQQNTLSEKTLLKKKVSELKELCKQRSLCITGTKKVLIERLTGKEQPKPQKKKKTNKKPVWDIQQESISIRRNEHGNYEHYDTGLVFDSKTSKVIGKQDKESKTILELNEKDIEICNTYSFEYEIPNHIN